MKKKKAVKKTAKKTSATISAPKVPPAPVNALQNEIAHLTAKLATLEARFEELEVVLALQKKPAIPSWREWPVYWGLTR